MTNHPREDAIFSTKVKGALLGCSGTGSMVAALLDFRVRHESAQQDGQPGLSYEQFLAYLRQHGVVLSDFESRYLCRSFDDDGAGSISAATFLRHLTGLNHRRLQAVLQAWDSLDKNANDEVPRAALVSTRAERSVLTVGGGGSPGFESTFQDGGARDQLKATLAATTHRSGVDGAADAEAVGKDEFVAFYAGISRRVGTDEEFVRLVLREWAADAASRPTLNETVRDWGEEGDPLVISGPRFVHDALTMELGRSSKEYNYSHMQRVHPYVEPLPPLCRPAIMSTTVQQTYRPHSQEQQDFSDPLLTRRGQLM